MNDRAFASRRHVVMTLPAALFLAVPRGGRAAGDGGVTISRQPYVAALSALRLGGAFSLDMSHDTVPSVEITGAREIVARLRVTVSGGRVAITTPPHVDQGTYPVPHVTARTPDLAELDLDGSIAASVRGIDAPRFLLRMAGAVTARLSGTAGDARIVSHGSSTIRASGLRVRDLVADLHGATDMSAFATRRADIALYGAGHVHVGGDPPVQSVRSFGSGSVSVD